MRLHHLDADRFLQISAADKGGWLIKPIDTYDGAVDKAAAMHTQGGLGDVRRHRLRIDVCQAGDRTFPYRANRKVGCIMAAPTWQGVDETLRMPSPAAAKSSAGSATSSSLALTKVVAPGGVIPKLGAVDKIFTLDHER